LDDFQTLEKIYENIDAINGATKTKLEDSKENAFMSKRLCILDEDSPVPFDIEACRVHEFNAARVREDFVKLNFNSLLRRLEVLYPEVRGAEKQKPAPQEEKQASLF